MLKHLIGLAVALLIALPASAQTDAISLATVNVVNAPDVRAWPITAAITSISFDGSVSRFEFTKHHGPSRWPDITPAGWDGPIQYTVWLFRKVGGQWAGSGFIQFWESRDGTGTPNDPDVPSRYHDHWFYGTAWRPLVQSDPIRAGEKIGFMVVAGSQRAGSFAVSVKERSNIVLVAATDRGVYNFGTQPAPEPTPAPTPTPDPVPTPIPPPTPAPETPVDLTGILARLDALEAAQGSLVARVGVLEARPIPVSCSVSAGFGIKLSCKVGF